MIAITQTTALLVDAYRELNDKKLFWLALGVNAIVIGIFASLGISDRGVSFWHFTLQDSSQISSFLTPESFYKTNFVTWGIPFLSWASTVLALISTAGIIPELVTGGTIETMLSKPIGRIRLLLTKFVLGLLFVTLQVTVFSAGCFLTMWIRGGTIEPQLFLAVPIVVLFFSYLFSVCIVVGLLTRSTIASLLITVLLWFVIFLVNIADANLVAQREGTLLQLEQARERLETQQAFADDRLEAMQASGEELLDAEGNPITDPEQRRLAVNVALRMAADRVDDREIAADTWVTWARYAYWVKTVLPKTGETIAIIRRSIITRDDLMRAMGVEDPSGASLSVNEEEPAFASDASQRRAAAAIDERSMFWVIGTSVGFELVMLTLACLIFSRRDF
ncbi:MAG: ABC transporter permease subunit [Planctomycetota bacterium]